MINKLNELRLRLPAISANESACRSIIGVFCAQLDPTIEEIADLKCAVSEAVTNCIVHAYFGKGGIIYITAKLFSNRQIRIEIKDKGCGIPNVKQAREPLFTTDTDGERSGMGFSVMETFTDRLSVSSKPGKGTKVTLTKQFT